MDILAAARAETLEALAEPVITALGTIAAGYLAVRATKPDRSRLVIRHDTGDASNNLQLVGLRVPVTDVPGPSRASWRMQMVWLLLAAVVFLVPFGYCFYRFIASDFREYSWIGAALLFEMPGGLLLGSFFSMVQIGMEDASSHAQQFQVEGDLRLVAQRTQDVMQRMKLRVHAIELDESSATIEACPPTKPRRLHVSIVAANGRCEVEVKSTMPPSLRSYRRNGSQVTRFIEELVGVRIHPALWTERGKATAAGAETSIAEESSSQADAVGAPARGDRQPAPPPPAR